MLTVFDDGPRGRQEKREIAGSIHGFTRHPPSRQEEGGAVQGSREPIPALRATLPCNYREG